MVNPAEGPKQPDENVTYREDFNQSVDLFAKSFDAYQGAKEPHKKEVLDDVMQKALHAMGQSAAGMLNKELQAKKEKLQQDLEAYTSSSTDENRTKVEDDISSLKS